MFDYMLLETTNARGKKMTIKEALKEFLTDQDLLFVCGKNIAIGARS